jgi:hypothetical protein
MLSQTNYLIRSKIDGKYLVARPQMSEGKAEAGYLLIFREHFEALSYLNTHGKNMANNFGVESISANSLKGLLQRWGFNGIGVVEDPLLPKIQFLSYS